VNKQFTEVNKKEWPSIRDTLIREYPLDMCEIREIVLRSYDKLLQTRIGDPADDIKIFEDVDIGAQATGAFLETIIANEFQKRNSVWRQGSEAEKDLIHTNNPKFSTEIKLSGQVNDKIFGNRSYAQDTSGSNKKGKSGYYIALNIHISKGELLPSHNLFLMRFGWIDFEDWSGQKAESGQAAKLNSDVYKNKMTVIEGNYLKDAPVELVYMIGESRIESVSDFLDKHGIVTVGEFVKAYQSENNPSSDMDYIYNKCLNYPNNTVTMDQNINLFSDTIQSSIN